MTMTGVKITARMLYDIVNCEHRPWMDLHADPALRDAVSPFVELLWRNSRAHEDATMSATQVAARDLRAVPPEDRAHATLEAMRASESLIYGGLIEADDLRGEPDLLRLSDTGRYLPGDIKSGSADEGPSDGVRRPKERYAVQLALYVDVLERLGLSAGRRAFVWDIKGREVEYDLTAPEGSRTPTSFWDDYLRCIGIARAAIAGDVSTEPASCAACKLCVWFTACAKTLEDRGDLTLIPGLGRTMRDALHSHVANMAELAAAAPDAFLDEKSKSIIRGIGSDSIRKFQARAVLITTRGVPCLTREVMFPRHPTELFFDIESDPGHEHCYLHGFVERRQGVSASEVYFPFFSDQSTEEAEREAFRAAWQFVQSRRPCTLYIYSKTERTWWRYLQARYPDVCSVEELEDVFCDANSVDLLEVVNSATEWPTYDRSIKTLARYLGFVWRDPHPSGAASIEWYDRYLRGDAAARQRILDYNEDDCLATRVLLDGIKQLRVMS